MDPLGRGRPLNWAVGAAAGAGRFVYNNLPALLRTARQQQRTLERQDRALHRAHDLLQSLRNETQSGEGPRIAPWVDNSSSSSSSSSYADAPEGPTVPAPPGGRQYFPRRSQRRPKRSGYRKYRKPYKKKATEYDTFVAKCTYAFNVKTNATNASKAGQVLYDIPMDQVTAAYSRDDFQGGSFSTNYLAYNSNDVVISTTPQALEPFSRLRIMYDKYRVTGIKIRFWPHVTHETDDTNQFQALYGLWVSADYEDPCGTNTFVTALTGVDATMYERYITHRKYAQKMDITKPWTRFFRVKNPIAQFRTDNAKGGNAGAWYPSDHTLATTTQWGKIFIEQPTVLGSNGMSDKVLGRIEVTKYISLKDFNVGGGRVATTSESASG